MSTTTTNFKTTENSSTTKYTETVVSLVTKGSGTTGMKVSSTNKKSSTSTVWTEIWSTKPTKQTTQETTNTTNTTETNPEIN